jgi:flagellar motor switch protein FliG
MVASGLHKAAVLLLSLPRKQAEPLLDRLDPAQAKAVRAEMARLRDPDRNEQEAIVREFASGNEAIAREREGAEGPPFEFLDEVDGGSLLAAIVDENPQTIAFILSYLPPVRAAAVLAELPFDVRRSLIARIAALGETSSEVVRDVEDVLRNRLAEVRDRSPDRRGVASAVRILHAMPPAHERDLLGALAESDPDLVQVLRRVMFGVDVPMLGDCDMAPT